MSVLLLFFSCGYIDAAEHAAHMQGALAGEDLVDLMSDSGRYPTGWKENPLLAPKPFEPSRGSGEVTVTMGWSVLAPGDPQDPDGPESGTLRVVRGGAARSAPTDLRSANRLMAEPDQVDSALGFRLGRTLYTYGDSTDGGE